MARRTSIGLDIGSSAVRVAQLRLGLASVTLERLDELALPDGAVRSGHVEDPEAVAATLAQLWRRCRPRGVEVMLGLGTADLTVEPGPLPVGGPTRSSSARPAPPGLVTAVLESAAATSSRASALRLFDAVEPSGRRALQIAAPRRSVEAAVEAVELAGLLPCSVDLSAFAVLRALGSPADDSAAQVPTGEALLDIGADLTTLVLHVDGWPRAVQVRPGGAREVTMSLANRLGMAPDVAERVKRSLTATSAASGPGAGRPASGRPASGRPDEPAVGAAALELARHVAEAAASHIATTLARCLRDAVHSAQAAAERLVLTGGGAALVGLGPALRAATGLPVVVGAPLADVRVGRLPRPVAELEQVEGRAAVAIGLALGALP